MNSFSPFLTPVHDRLAFSSYLSSTTNFFSTFFWFFSFLFSLEESLCLCSFSQVSTWFFCCTNADVSKYFYLLHEELLHSADAVLENRWPNMTSITLTLMFGFKIEFHRAGLLHTNYVLCTDVSVYLCLHLASYNHSGSDSSLSHSDLQKNCSFRQADGIWRNLHISFRNNHQSVQNRCVHHITTGALRAGQWEVPTVTKRQREN